MSENKLDKICCLIRKIPQFKQVIVVLITSGVMAMVFNATFNIISVYLVNSICNSKTEDLRRQHFKYNKVIP
jgi:hypothetical protein